MWLSFGVVCVILRLAVLIQYQSVTDTHTHTHTDTRRRHIPRLARRRAVKKETEGKIYSPVIQKETAAAGSTLHVVGTKRIARRRSSTGWRLWRPVDARRHNFGSHCRLCLAETATAPVSLVIQLQVLCHSLHGRLTTSARRLQSNRQSFLYTW